MYSFTVCEGLYKPQPPPDHKIAQPWTKKTGFFVLTVYGRGEKWLIRKKITLELTPFLMADLTLELIPELTPNYVN